MRVQSSFAVLLAAAGARVAAQATTTTTSEGPKPTTGALGDAEAVLNNPTGVIYKATLPPNAFFKGLYPNGGNIEGSIEAVASDDGHGVKFSVRLQNLPTEGGPFGYHLHAFPVPADGNCTETKAHLDPYIRGQDEPCDKSKPQTCEVGDLSGKHGAIKPNADGSFEHEYVDFYASTLEGIGSFFGNRSIVFHLPNKTRISCANFERVSGSVPLPGGNTTIPYPSGTGTTPNPGGPSTTGPVLGAASSLKVGLAGVVAFGAAVVFAL